MKRERVFFDTQVYSNVAGARLDVGILRSTLRVRKSVCVLTPITLLELLEWLLTAPDEHEFIARQKALSLAWEFGAKNLLDFPGRFARLKLFGTAGPTPKFGAAHFKKWVWVAAKAKSIDALSSGRVSWPSSASRTKTYGLDPGTVCNLLSEGRAHYAQQISRYLSEIEPKWRELRKQGAKTLLNAEQLEQLDATLQGGALKVAFIQGLAKSIGIPTASDIDSSTIQGMIDRLDAAFTHRKFILRQALTTMYDFERDASAFNDLQQLFYLADPAFVFVTEDGRLRHAVMKSKQASRILSFAQFTVVVGKSQHTPAHAVRPYKSRSNWSNTFWTPT